MAERPPDDEHHAQGNSIDADRLVQDWEHALDAASEAVSVSSRSHSLSAKDAAVATKHIQSDRSWLQSVRTRLREFFPTRKRAEKPPDAT